jgi:hypothetical protein
MRRLAEVCELLLVVVVPVIIIGRCENRDRGIQGMSQQKLKMLNAFM